MLNISRSRYNITYNKILENYEELRNTPNASYDWPMTAFALLIEEGKKSFYENLIILLTDSLP